MILRILHLLDFTTPAGAVESLALLLAADTSTQHQLAVLGHRSTKALLDAAGLSDHDIHWLPSMGWADPTGWRACRRLIRRIGFTHVHAWGITAAVAAAMARTQAHRIITLAELPATSRWPFHLVDQGGFRRGSNATAPQWTTPSAELKRTLISYGLPVERIDHIPPGINAAPMAPMPELREALGLGPADGPILLMGGELKNISAASGGIGGRSRHDYGLWVAAIAQRFLPNIRVVVRDDIRGRQNPGLERLLNDLPDGEIPVAATAEYSWDQLLSIADALLVTADGPITMGAALHAMAAGVPVIGTPIEAVREIIDDGRNGLIAAELIPRSIAARVEDLFADDALRQRIVAEAREDVATRFPAKAMTDAYHAIYAMHAPMMATI